MDEGKLTHQRTLYRIIESYDASVIDRKRSVLSFPVTKKRSNPLNLGHGINFAPTYQTQPLCFAAT